VEKEITAAAKTLELSKEAPIVALQEAMLSHVSADPIEPLLDVRKAAELLGISPKTLRDWIQARKIEYVKVGTRVMFQPASIRQFVAANTRRAASK
jgi:excisionase family DNA binding protein